MTWMEGVSGVKEKPCRTRALGYQAKRHAYCMKTVVHVMRHASDREEKEKAGELPVVRLKERDAASQNAIATVHHFVAGPPHLDRPPVGHRVTILPPVFASEETQEKICEPPPNVQRIDDSRSKLFRLSGTPVTSTVAPMFTYQFTLQLTISIYELTLSRSPTIAIRCRISS
jgi:hypothetical protein